MVTENMVLVLLLFNYLVFGIFIVLKLNLNGIVANLIFQPIIIIYRISKNVYIYELMEKEEPLCLDNKSSEFLGLFGIELGFDSCIGNKLIYNQIGKIVA